MVSAAKESTFSDPIVFNIARPPKTEAQKYETFIHRDEIKHIYEFMQQQFLAAERDERNERKDTTLNPNTFFISSGRGCGKTTFLKTLELHLSNRLKDKKEDVHVAFLAYIDPTRIESREHPLFTIISAIHRRVIESLNNPARHKNLAEDRKNWDKQINKISNGLSILGTLSHASSDAWQDPKALLEKSLRNATSATELEKDFHDLVDVARQILDVRGFCVIFDDIETDAERVWKVIDTIRCYLTSPYLVSVVAGDLDLYSLYIHQKYKKSFDAEAYKKDEVRKTVSAMENQLLLKLFSLERRIYLDNILRKYEDSKSSVRSDKKHIVLQDWEDGKPEVGEWLDVRESVEAMLRSVLSDDPQLPAMIDFFLSLPFRQLVQFLHVLDRKLKQKDPTKRICKDKIVGGAFTQREAQILFAEVLADAISNNELLGLAGALRNLRLLQFEDQVRIFSSQKYKYISTHNSPEENFRSIASRLLADFDVDEKPISQDRIRYEIGHRIFLTIAMFNGIDISTTSREIKASEEYANMVIENIKRFENGELQDIYIYNRKYNNVDEGLIMDVLDVVKIAYVANQKSYFSVYVGLLMFLEQEAILAQDKISNALFIQISRELGSKKKGLLAKRDDTIRSLMEFLENQIYSLIKIVVQCYRLDDAKFLYQFLTQNEIIRIIAISAKNRRNYYCLKFLCLLILAKNDYKEAEKYFSSPKILDDNETQKYDSALKIIEDALGYPAKELIEKGESAAIKLLNKGLSKKELQHLWTPDALLPKKS